MRLTVIVFTAIVFAVAVATGGTCSLPAPLCEYQPTSLIQYHYLGSHL